MDKLFRFDIFLETFPKLMKALPTTLAVGILAMIIGLAVGTLIAIERHHPLPVLDQLLAGYVSFFRGTPLMIQLFIFFFGLPQIWPSLGRIDAFEAAVIVMSVNASAYAAESVRAAIGSVDPLQQQAGLAVGLTPIQTMFLIQLPQAFRVAIPPLGNTFIGIIQGTSLTFMLGLRDIMGQSKMLAAANYRFLETYVAVGLVYWAITILISQLNRRLEMKLTIGG